MPKQIALCGLMRVLRTDTKSDPHKAHLRGEACGLLPRGSGRVGTLSERAADTYFQSGGSGGQRTTGPGVTSRVALSARPFLKICYVRGRGRREKEIGRE